MDRRGKRGNQNKKEQSVIEEQPLEEDKEEEEEDEDDKINEELFSMYDDMFKHFNDFGAMFQNSAHLIGQLIRKNMILNQQNEQLETILPQKDKELKESEKAYEELLQQLSIKDRQIEELQGENTGLRLQMEQLLHIKRPAQPAQRDILKEREQAALQSSRNSKQGKHQSKNDSFERETVGNPKNQSNQNMQPPKQKMGSGNQEFMAGTYESFFDLDKVLQHPSAENDSCSLKDLFSQKMTKKRKIEEINQNSKEEDEKWIGVKRKKRKSYAEDSQLAERFDQLSQAFFQASKGVSGSGSTEQQPSLKFGRNSIGSEIGVLGGNNEDSVSSTSIINACIKFDSKQARENIVQSKIAFQKQQQEKKNDPKFFLKMVDQASESQKDDFFQIKKDKKEQQKQNKSLATTTRSNSGANNKKPQKKQLL